MYGSTTTYSTVRCTEVYFRTFESTFVRKYESTSVLRVRVRVRVGIFPDLRRKISANEMRLEPRMQKPAPGALFPGYFAQLSYFSD